jgi:hypothetical protein
MPLGLRILVGCVLITIVALVSDRSRLLAGIFATAPINIPIILWILWGKGENDYTSLQDVSRSMLFGMFSTVCFVAVCWYGFSRRWSFAQTLMAGYGAWAVTVLVPLALRRLFERL